MIEMSQQCMTKNLKEIIKTLTRNSNKNNNAVRILEYIKNAEVFNDMTY